VSLDKHRINNEISFSDVNDRFGLYFDLSNYTKNRTIPFDLDLLVEQAKQLQDEWFWNKTKVKKF